MSDVRFIYLTCWVQIYIVHWLWVSRGAISYYLWRVLHLWFIRRCGRDCAATLYHRYGFKRDPNFLCPSLLTLSSPPSLPPLLLRCLNPDGEQTIWCDHSLLSASAALCHQTRGRWQEKRREEEEKELLEKKKWLLYKMHSLSANIMELHLILLKKANNTTLWHIRLLRFNAETDINGLLLGFFKTAAVSQPIYIYLCYFAPHLK